MALLPLDVLKLSFEPAISLIRIKLPYGGPGGNRTLVQNAFALKELQQ
jgi:hypothetical protein